MTTSTLKEQKRELHDLLVQSPLTELRTKNPVTPVQRRQPIRSLAQISPEPNTEVIEYYLPYSPTEINSGSTTFADKSNNIDQEKVRNSNKEIAVYNTDLKERRSKFLSPTVSPFSSNLPRTYKKVEATNNHQQKRSQELQVYLESLKNEARDTREVEFSESVINLSGLVWGSLKSSFDGQGLCLKVPDACPGLNNNFMYTWSNADHYLECEIFGTGEIEFFYKDRNNGQVWGEDTTLEKGFSTDILDKAALFIE
jgi:hypothetical protein